MVNPAIHFCQDQVTDGPCEPVEPRHRPRPLAHYQEAIAEHFVEFERWLDIRPLWECGVTRHFRVNFWKSDPLSGQSWIWRSIFLSIDDHFDGLSVREIT